MLKSWICSLLMIVASLAASADDGATPPVLSPADAHEVRAVVEAQLKALAGNDAPLAFSYAAPEIKNQFGDAATFVAMVRRTYPMLIRPASVSFYQPEGLAGVVLQVVRFRDGDGQYWRAVYQLNQQPDKHWRIGGCVVAPDDDSATT
jgi:hypothetical protein